MLDPTPLPRKLCDCPDGFCHAPLPKPETPKPAPNYRASANLLIVSALFLGAAVALIGGRLIQLEILDAIK